MRVRILGGGNDWTPAWREVRRQGAGGARFWGVLDLGCDAGGVWAEAGQCEPESGRLSVDESNTRTLHRMVGVEIPVVVRPGLRSPETELRLLPSIVSGGAALLFL
jgi:hypothetical protein